MSASSLVWLVTGCSSGFGTQFVTDILQRGDKAIATARNVDSLKELASMGAPTLQLDVTVSLGELESKIQQAIKIYGHIDVLISNAGYVELAPVEILGNNLLKQFQTNTFATINLITAIMPHWRERKSGFLVVNSSMLARWDINPCAGAYCASKAALDQLITTFTAEVADLGYIRTLIINPGFHRSLLTEPSRYAESFASEWPGYSDWRATMIEFAPKIHSTLPGDATKAAKLTIDMVRGEGAAAGKKLPPFLPMGSDAYEAIKKRLALEQQVLEEWEDVIKSTDIAAQPVAHGQANGH